MAAVIKAYRDSGVLTSGHGTTQANVDNADAGSVTYARNEAGTTVIPIPTATGTHFSWDLWLQLYCVSGGGSTHISNKNAQLDSSQTTGIHQWFKAVAVGSYVQPTGNLAVDAGTDGATPAGYTEIISASATSWDSTSIAAVNSTQASKYLQTGIGVDHLFTGGGGTASLVLLDMIYDEGP